MRTPHGTRQNLKKKPTRRPLPAATIIPGIIDCFVGGRGFILSDTSSVTNVLTIYVQCCVCRVWVTSFLPISVQYCKVWALQAQLRRDGGMSQEFGIAANT